MKRYVVGGLLLLLVVGAATFAYAATSTNTPAPAQAQDGVRNLPQPTEKQKAELTELQNQMLSIREKMLDKYVEYGWITSDQANYAKDQIQLQKKYAGTVGKQGLGGGRGFRGGRGCQGGGVTSGGMMSGGMMGYGGMMGW